MNTYTEFTEQYGIRDTFRSLKAIYKEDIYVLSNNEKSTMEIYIHGGFIHNENLFTLPILKDGESYSLDTDLSGNTLLKPENIDTLNKIADITGFKHKEDEKAVKLYASELERHIKRNIENRTLKIKNNTL